MTKILLVDDETIILNMLGHYLRTSGWEVCPISDSSKAVEILKSDEHYDIMISDIRMTPVNGLDLLKTSKQCRPEMPVILITGYASRETFKQASDLGAFKCLAKPFPPEALLQIVENALNLEAQ